MYSESKIIQFLHGVSQPRKKKCKIYKVIKKYSDSCVLILDVSKNEIDFFIEDEYIGSVRNVDKLDVFIATDKVHQTLKGEGASCIL